MGDSGAGTFPFDFSAREARSKYSFCGENLELLKNRQRA
jgi:hypothetical protein